MKKKLAKAIKIGKFVKTMQPDYAEPDEVMKAHGTTYADIKYDGYRVQVHKGKTDFKIFTRNGNELNYECYPEIVKIVKKLPECLIEAELVGDGNNHKEVFDKVKKRFRRPGINQKSLDNYLSSGIIKETPLSLRVFDTLVYEGKEVAGLPLEQRRKYVENFDGKGLQPAESQVVRNLDELEKILKSTFKKGEEGRVCKNPSSLYIPGRRNIDWVKFKRSEDLDLVVVGFYNEKAYGLDLPFTGVLCATYNEVTGRYETIGKVATIRNGVAGEIFEQVKGNIVEEMPGNVDFSEKLEKKTHKKFVPEKYIKPEDSVVLQIKAMNINYTDNWQTCGKKNGKAFSMRIGYVDEIRYDKDPIQATKTKAVEKIYEMQGGSE